MSKANREYADVESQFQQAEKELRKLCSARLEAGIPLTEALQQIEAMSTAFAWHSVENREQQTRIGHLETRLHDAQARTDKGIEALRAAAELRASVQKQIMAEMKALTPKAIQQARQGKPALLRLILRSTR